MTPFEEEQQAKVEHKALPEKFLFEMVSRLNWQSLLEMEGASLRSKVENYAFFAEQAERRATILLGCRAFIGAKKEESR